MRWWSADFLCGCEKQQHSDFCLFSNSRGKVVKPLQFQSTVAPGTVARVEPNIKWFSKCTFFLLSFFFFFCICFTSGQHIAFIITWYYGDKCGINDAKNIWINPVIPCIFINCISANTRVIKQSSLQKFQEEMGAVQKDPYRVVMRQSKLPMSLLHDRVKAHVSIKGFLLVLKRIKVSIFCLVQSLWWFLWLYKGSPQGTRIVNLNLHL